ncbi:TatD family hydrolase [Methanopyrus sp. SNP6]|uniref:TatD family hydrolase n=1 Tax=Methanopyrus sp. SNP6 TaxID=1937005 RepID=UPI001438B642|nr:TatD family hydrolase [Methanopyrus sp. SNP6]
MKKPVDAHCHLCFEHFKGEEDEVVERSRKKVLRVYDCGATPGTARRTLELAERFEGFVFPTIGLHPPRAPRMQQSVIDDVVRIIREHTDRIAAIGEIGLDYYYVKEPGERRKMREIFERFLKLAEELDKPVVIHARDAEEHALEVLEGYDVVAMFHCYDGSAELARRIADAGHYVSLSTIHVIRGSKDERTRELLETVPLGAALTETDSPYLSPVRGERNEPRNVWRIIELLARVKGVPVDEVVETTTRNALEFYDL